MENVTIQIRTSVNWESCEAIAHIFDTWNKVSDFAYRLALQTNKEIRVENKGQGHYYNPNNALRWLKQ